VACSACVIYTPVTRKSAERSLVNCAYAFSPLVEETPEHVVLDIEGCELLFGSPREIAKKSLTCCGAGVESQRSHSSKSRICHSRCKMFCRHNHHPFSGEAKRLGEFAAQALDADFGSGGSGSRGGRF